MDQRRPDGDLLLRRRARIKREFLVALAIVDDLGALLVIAIFYTASIDWRGVALIAALLLALWVANRFGARRGPIYLLLGVGLWAGFFISGLHATLAGVLTALLVPARVKIVPGALPQVIRRGADNIEAQALDNEPDAMDPDRVAIIGAIGGSLDAATAPLQRFEHMVQPWVTYGIRPKLAPDAPSAERELFDPKRTVR